MKKLIVAVCVAIMLFIMAASPAFAGGDKVRGDKGQGSVNQSQVMDPPPFQP